MNSSESFIGWSRWIKRMIKLHIHILGSLQLFNSISSASFIAEKVMVMLFLVCFVIYSYRFSKANT